LNTVHDYRFSFCSYKTKKAMQEKGLNPNLLHHPVPPPFPPRRIPVQMLVRDGKPCPADLVANANSGGGTGNGKPFGEQLTNAGFGSFGGMQSSAAAAAAHAGFMQQTAAGHLAALPASQYYMHNTWGW
jgi:hypothetical protein